MSLARRSQIRQSFSRAALSYERAASHQQTIASHLLDIVKSDQQSALLACFDKTSQWLDAGSGTGFVSRLVKQQGLAKQIMRIDIAESMLKQDRGFDHQENSEFLCADVQYLPLQNACLDLVLSSYAFQWADNIDALFAELFRVLKPGAAVYFSIPAPRTFEELKSAWQGIDDRPHVHEFMSQQTIVSAAEAQGLDCQHFSQRLDVLPFAHQRQALAHIKDIGAHNLDEHRSRHLLGKQHYFQFSQAFRQHSKNSEGYSLSYHSYFFGFVKTLETSL